MKLLLCVYFLPWEFIQLPLWVVSPFACQCLMLDLLLLLITGREKVGELWSDTAADCCYSQNSLSLIFSIYDQFMMMAQVLGSGWDALPISPYLISFNVVFKSLYMIVDFCVQDSLLHCIVHQEIFSIHIFVSTFNHSVSFFS